MSQQIDLSKLSREEIIDIAKRQSQQLRDKNARLADLQRQVLIPDSEKDQQIENLKKELFQKVTQLSQHEEKMAIWKEKVMQITKQDALKIQQLEALLDERQRQINTMADIINKNQGVPQPTAYPPTPRGPPPPSNEPVALQMEMQRKLIKDLTDRATTAESRLEQLTNRLQESQRRIDEYATQRGTTLPSDVAQQNTALQARVAQLETQLAEARAAADSEREAQQAHAASLLAGRDEAQAALQARVAQLETQLAEARAAAVSGMDGGDSPSGTERASGGDVVGQLMAKVAALEAERTATAASVAEWKRKVMLISERDRREIEELNEKLRSVAPRSLDEDVERKLSNRVVALEKENARLHRRVVSLSSAIRIHEAFRDGVNGIVRSVD